MSLRKRILLVLLIAGGAAGVYLWRSYRSEPPVGFGSFRGYNILLITIDTLRADHLPLYGYQEVRTPNLDQLGADSVVFEDAIAHVPLTLPSHVSILTGLLPPQSGVRDNSGFFLRPEITTLAEILRSGGYDTGAFVSAFVVDSIWQIDQGFDTYFDDFVGGQDVERRAEETVAVALSWLKKPRSIPFFCWIHLYDPHDPYDPPEPFKSEYASSPYDGEIAYSDHSLGTILATLRENGEMQRTVIVVTSDHGESFGEHQEYGHSLFIYNATQHVPLLVYLPGREASRIQATVGLIDIPPTLLDLAGLSQDPEMDGKSLTPVMNHLKENLEPVYGESLYARLHFGWSPLRSLTTSEYRYIEAPKPELYDRVNDPGDLRNLVAEKPQVLKMFRDRLSLFPEEGAVAPQKVDSETAEKLRSLGYLSGGVNRTAEGKKTDPKDRIRFYQNHQDALTEMKRKDYAKALSLLEPMLVEEPTLVDVQLSAGIAYSASGEYEKAIECYQKALSIRPGYFEAISNLAATYERSGRLDDAVFWYSEMLNDPGRKGVALLRLANLYRGTGRISEAEAHFQEARSWFQEMLDDMTNPKTRSHTYFLQAELYLQAGDAAQAELFLRKAIEEAPKEPLLHFNLALLLEQKEDIAGAIAEYETELGISPSFAAAYLNLGRLYQRVGRVEEAEICFQKYRQLNP